MAAFLFRIESNSVRWESASSEVSHESGQSMIRKARCSSQKEAAFDKIARAVL